MLSLKIKDLKYRNLYSKHQTKIILNKFLFISLLNKKSNKKKVIQKKFKILSLLLKSKLYNNLKYKTKTKMVRRCAISNRGRGTFRPYGLSRFFLREFMQFGILPGYKKSV